MQSVHRILRACYDTEFTPHPPYIRLWLFGFHCAFQNPASTVILSNFCFKLLGSSSTLYRNVRVNLLLVLTFHFNPSFLIVTHFPHCLKCAFTSPPPNICTTCICVHWQKHSTIKKRELFFPLLMEKLGAGGGCVPSFTNQNTAGSLGLHKGNDKCLGGKLAIVSVVLVAFLGKCSGPQ